MMMFNGTFSSVPVVSRISVLALVTCCMLPDLAQAQSATGQASFSGRSFESVHRGTFNGVTVDYVAKLDETIITNDEGEETASFFATSYVRNGLLDVASRPVVFFWNGGPSASSQWLHMAGFGPKRLVVPADVHAKIAPPYETKDNLYTILDVADLVFIDPVETGFSRILPAGDRAWFYTDDGDAESNAAFIQAWLKKNGRDDSPTFVLGTSYGSIRAALVAGVLAGSPMPSAGAILFSQGLNLVETTQRNNNIVGYASNMAQIAAIAWYHGKGNMLDKPVTTVIDTMHDFAMGDYLVALAQGRFLPAAKQRSIAGRLAGMTGISAEYYLANNLVIKKSTFTRELLKDDGLVLGMSDARYTAAADDEAGPANPSSGAPEVMRIHMREFLGVDIPLEEYRAMAPDSGRDWDYVGWTTLGGRKVAPGSKRSIFADFDYPGVIKDAFEANEQFRVFIATGIYDTLTTVGPARLLAATPGYPDDRVEAHEYIGGHAFYSNDEDFARLADDLRKFLARNDTSDVGSR